MTTQPDDPRTWTTRDHRAYASLFAMLRDRIESPVTVRLVNGHGERVIKALGKAKLTPSRASAAMDQIGLASATR